VRLLTREVMKGRPHLELHPFGQIPTLEEWGLGAVFETGAIILRLAERHPGLLPRNARARAIA
jgi:glutathione S-transferase